MKVNFLPEPELEFGVDRHIDIRFGLMNYGPLDFASPLAPKQIKLGIVGTAETNEGVQRWLEKCRTGILAKPSKRPNLFPRFPGFGPDRSLATDLVIDAQLQRTIPQRKFDELCRKPKSDQAITEIAQTFLEELEYLAQKTTAEVLICALPFCLVEFLEQEPEAEDETSSDDSEVHKQSATVKINHHDLLKARAMKFRRPTQVVRPSTYDEAKQLKRRGKPGQTRRVQDEATRAWNFYTALYYKAGGIPWRLARDPSQLSVCYVGVSFYKALDESKLLTSTAQVFNERGEGVILRGGTARMSKDDLQIHLAEEDAYNLLLNSLEIYRHEHKNFPARVVIHKSSVHNDEEIRGFREALRKLRVEQADFISITNSMTRLFRSNTYPPLRGTFWETDSHVHILYTKGSVDFFSAYPGLYIPRPLGFRCDAVEETPKFLAQEILALTKMNWNNSQFDGGEPITTRAAAQVGSILKYVGDNDPIEPYYRYYM